MIERGATAIVLVEDNPDDREAIADALSPLDAALTCCGTAAEALAAIDRADYAVAIIDIGLPDADGIELAERIRARPSGLHLPIIFLTGAAPRNRDARRGYALSAVDYLEKSVPPDILRAKVSVFLDMFELRQESAAVSSRLGAVLNAAQSAIIGLDTGGRIAIANPSARRMLDRIDDDLPMPWPPEIRFLGSQELKPLEEEENPLTRAMSGEVLVGETCILSHGDGDDQRYVTLSSSGMANGEPSDVACVLILDDVTEREIARQQVERAGRLDALGQLTGGIAHDFNNLLATVDYGIQLAAQAADPAKRAQYLETALRTIKRGGDLTQRLLAFAQRQPGRSHPNRVADLFADFREMARPAIEAAISIDLRCIDSDLTVYCDAAQLENALLNLVLNARDAMLGSGTGDRIVIEARGVGDMEVEGDLHRADPATVVARGLQSAGLGHRGRLTYRLPEDCIEIAVSDNGPGMSEEVKRRAIDPFFSTKEQGSGTGLGLSIVYGFVQQSRGELRIYSEPGYGTTIRLILPRGVPGQGTKGKASSLPIRAGEGQTILLVEDETVLLDMMKDVVESFGYRVVDAHSGPEALSLLETDATVDLLLTDIVMPGGIDGFEVARAARGIRPGLPVIYMSGYAGFSETEMGEVVAEIIQKPSPPAVVADAIDMALRGARGPGV